MRKFILNTLVAVLLISCSDTELVDDSIIDNYGLEISNDIQFDITANRSTPYQPNLGSGGKLSCKLQISSIKDGLIYYDIQSFLDCENNSQWEVEVKKESIQNLGIVKEKRNIRKSKKLVILTDSRKFATIE